MLEIKNIKKVYETGSFKQNALNDVSISFRQCEFVSILGPSGSGKTTLLNIIGGLDKYTDGDLIINGISTKKFKDRDWDTYRNHRVGFVFQSYNLISHQSVLSNVELALTLCGVNKKERRKRSVEALEKVGLKDHIHKKPNQLSGGQMQRVAIARALVNDPDILLADEPTGALDSKTSKSIMKLLKEVSKDRLVIMVTHNPELANLYSTRIVELKDGEIVSDSDKFKSTEEVLKNHKSRKTSMSFFTALSLSLNNLMTKKGRTILTAFAGSIGIIGIAAILSLSNGIQNYIDKTEEETLSSYPLMLEKKSVDMGSMVEAFAGNVKAEKHNDNKIYSANIMGDMFETMTKKAKSNDLKSFKEYIEKNKKLDKYVTDIQYGYNFTLNLYKNDDSVTRVNPTTIFDSLGMSTNGISSVYSTYMTNYDVFKEMINNDKLNKKQYDLVDGSWPENYNELVLMVDKDNRISDYTLYSLGILSQDELKKSFNKMTSGEEVSFNETSYETKDLIGLTYKLVLSADYYQKEGNFYVDKSDDKDYMKKVLANSEELKIVGIIKPNEESVVKNMDSAGMVMYTHDLTEHIVNINNEKEIVKEQLNNKNVNVFTGKSFDDTEEFSYENLTSEQLQYISSLSAEELAGLMKTYSDNANSTYENNLSTLGIANIDDPDTISIYPKDFDSKDEIIKVIDDFNKGKKEKDKLTYTDVVGMLMSSVSTIVDVVSTVLIAFVAISLIVSSIMIAIITYISVIERTKEIGILRAVGASKKDISRVFNAETLIEGAVAGIFGIIITVILCIPANIIIKNTVNISNIAVLPVGGAIILIIISIVLTVIAGLIPSRIASKKDPVEALRSE